MQNLPAASSKDLKSPMFWIQVAFPSIENPFSIERLPWLPPAPPALHSLVQTQGFSHKASPKAIECPMNKDVGVVVSVEHPPVPRTDARVPAANGMFCAAFRNASTVVEVQRHQQTNEIMKNINLLLSDAHSGRWENPTPSSVSSKVAELFFQTPAPVRQAVQALESPLRCWIRNPGNETEFLAFARVFFMSQNILYSAPIIQQFVNAIIQCFGLPSQRCHLHGPELPLQYHHLPDGVMINYNADVPGFGGVSVLVTNQGVFPTAPAGQAPPPPQYHHPAATVTSSSSKNNAPVFSPQQQQEHQQQQQQEQQQQKPKPTAAETIDMLLRQALELPVDSRQRLLQKLRSLIGDDEVASADDIVRLAQKLPSLSSLQSSAIFNSPFSALTQNMACFVHVQFDHSVDVLPWIKAYMPPPQVGDLIACETHAHLPGMGFELPMVKDTGRAVKVENGARIDARSPHNNKFFCAFNKVEKKEEVDRYLRLQAMTVEINGLLADVWAGTTSSSAQAATFLGATPANERGAMKNLGEAPLCCWIRSNHDGGGKRNNGTFLEFARSYFMSKSALPQDAHTRALVEAFVQRLARHYALPTLYLQVHGPESSIQFHLLPPPVSIVYGHKVPGPCSGRRVTWQGCGPMPQQPAPAAASSQQHPVPQQPAAASHNNSSHAAAAALSQQSHSYSTTTNNNVVRNNNDSSLLHPPAARSGRSNKEAARGGSSSSSRSLSYSADRESSIHTRSSTPAKQHAPTPTPTPTPPARQPGGAHSHSPAASDPQLQQQQQHQQQQHQQQQFSPPRGNQQQQQQQRSPSSSSLLPAASGVTADKLLRDVSMMMSEQKQRLRSVLARVGFFGGVKSAYAPGAPGAIPTLIPFVEAEVEHGITVDAVVGAIAQMHPEHQERVRRILFDRFYCRADYEAVVLFCPESGPFGRRRQREPADANGSSGDRSNSNSSSSSSNNNGGGAPTAACLRIPPPLLIVNGVVQPVPPGVSPISFPPPNFRWTTAGAKQ